MGAKLFIDKDSSIKLENFTHKLLNACEIRAIVIFGSAVTGNWNYRSDIDILIMSDAMGDDWFECNLRAYELCEGRVQPFVVNSEEFLTSIEDRRYIIWEALHDGVIVRDDDIFAKMRDRLMSLITEGQLIRLSNGWQFVIS